MKKLAFSVFAAALTFGANADVQTPAADGCCGFNGFYLGLGVAAVDHGIKVENSADSSYNNAQHCTRLAGTVAAGYGRVIKEKAYLGLEAGLDATQNSEFVSNDIKINGLIPSAALKLGYVHPSTKCMAYLKAGAAYSKAKLTNDDALRFSGTEKFEIKNSKWSPIVALGGEKLCGKHFRTRLEAEYRFRTNKSHEVIANETVKLVNKGAITLRAMAVYTFGGK